MDTVHIHKAHGITESVPVTSVTIILDEPLPQMGAACGYEEFRATLADEARRLADVLCRTLPGGVLDHLTAELMRLHASLFVVPRFDGTERSGS